MTKNTKVIAIRDMTSMKVTPSFAAIVLLQQQWQLCKERRKTCKRLSKNTIFVIVSAKEIVQFRKLKGKFV